jgi:hypothetical protein
MRIANFCAECGERLARSGWRARLGQRLCAGCAQRIGRFASYRWLIAIALVAIAAFALGRSLRPAPPPLIIQRAANSPLSDSPVGLSDARQANRAGTYQANQNVAPSDSNEEGYICGARTKKGTPCHRRVHAPGERCFQHKGLPAMVPLEKLVIRSK